jgi:hypothetical protein
MFNTTSLKYKGRVRAEFHVCLTTALHNIIVLTFYTVFRKIPTPIMEIKPQLVKT